MAKPKQATFAHIFASQTLCSVLCLWFLCTLPALGCCQLLCAATSSPAAHHGAQPAPAPVFFLMMLNEPGLGKDGLEQHELPLSVCNGRAVCPGQLMGTRTCQGLRPPLSAAATALEPAGALRSRAAPASSAPRPALESCLERQAGGGSDSTALGCSSSCCCLTGFPRPPTPRGIAPSRLSSPLWGLWLLACSPALALPLAQCWPRHQEPVLCSPLESRQEPSVAHGHPAWVSGFLLLTQKSLLPPRSIPRSVL